MKVKMNYERVEVIVDVSSQTRQLMSAGVPNRPNFMVHSGKPQPKPQLTSTMSALAPMTTKCPGSAGAEMERTS